MRKRITALRGQLNDRCESGNRVGKIIEDDGSRTLRLITDSKGNLVFVGKRGRLFAAERVKAIVAAVFVFLFVVSCLIALSLSRSGGTPVEHPTPYRTPNFNSEGPK